MVVAYLLAFIALSCYALVFVVACFLLVVLLLLAAVCAVIA